MLRRDRQSTSSFGLVASSGSSFRVVVAAGECEFRFYEELNSFLSPARRKCAFRHRFNGSPAVKETIEALGVPHTEIDLILMDGVPAPFSHRLRGGERVAVYPA